MYPHYSPITTYHPPLTLTTHSPIYPTIPPSPSHLLSHPNPSLLPLPPQNVYAPEEDPELKVEHYTRSTDQNELLGLDQMNVD